MFGKDGGQSHLKNVVMTSHPSGGKLPQVKVTHCCARLVVWDPDVPWHDDQVREGDLPEDLSPYPGIVIKYNVSLISYA